MKNENPRISERDQLEVLMKEHRVLYSLLEWRLTAADRRVVAGVGIFAAALTAIHTLGPTTAIFLLWGLPVSLWVTARITISHCRSKEDALRRLDEIERQVNTLAGVELLAFQSRHPSRGRAVGGRTGLEAINGTAAVCITLLVFCAFLYRSLVARSSWEAVCYAVYVSVVAAQILWSAWRLQAYGDARGSLFRERDR